MACLLISAIYCVFHLCYQVFDGISTCIICNNDGVYNILQGCVLHYEQKLAHSVLCFIDQTLNTALNIYLSCISLLPLNHSHDTKQSFMCQSVPVSLCPLINPLQHSICYCNSMKQPGNHTRAHSNTS